MHITHFAKSLLLIWLCTFPSIDVAADGPKAKKNKHPHKNRHASSNASVPLTAIRSINGTDHELRGAAGSSLLRIAAAAYPGDGSGEEMYEWPLAPVPRVISNVVAAQSYSVPNARGMSDMVWAWGQFLDHDIDLTHTSPVFGTADVPIPDPDDPLGPDPMPFDRSEYHPNSGVTNKPRQQMNNITAFIDASNVYGSDPERAAALRTFVNGEMKTSKGNLLPFNEDGFPNAGGSSADYFLAGDVRANEQVGLTALHTLFVREHNRLARLLRKKYRDADDESIYQAARKLVGAELQAITYKEFLPTLLGRDAPSLRDYSGFDEMVHPGIANEFSAASYRFGHSMLSPTLLLANRLGEFDDIALRDAFFNPSFLASDPKRVDYLLAGFQYQQAQEVDNLLVDDVRNFLFGPPGAGGFDLASLNIQRGRDHGIPTYNKVRAAYGLAEKTDFEDINPDPFVVAALAEVYDSVGEVDAWVGGLAETHVRGASVGELVGTVLSDQFTRLRDGDPFFYLNDPDVQSLRNIVNINKVTLAQVISLNTCIKKIRGNLFRVAQPQRRSSSR